LGKFIAESFKLISCTDNVLQHNKQQVASK